MRSGRPCRPVAIQDGDRWFVAATRPDAPDVPQGWYWYSDIRTVVPRSIEAIIQWAPLGADVDLHLGNPTGTDIAVLQPLDRMGVPGPRLHFDLHARSAQRDVAAARRRVSPVGSLLQQPWSRRCDGASGGPVRVRDSHRPHVCDGGTGATETLAAFTIGPDTGAVLPDVSAALRNLPPKGQQK